MSLQTHSVFLPFLLQLPFKITACFLQMDETLTLCVQKEDKNFPCSLAHTGPELWIHGHLGSVGPFLCGRVTSMNSEGQEWPPGKIPSKYSSGEAWKRQEGVSDSVI